MRNCLDGTFVLITRPVYVTLVVVPTTLRYRMKSTLRQTAEVDRSAIAAFLIRVFTMPADNCTTSADNLEWKYWTARPGAWTGSRSCVLERESHIVAHGAAWPLRILTESASVDTVHLIDWAADPTATGAGVSILKQMTKRVEAAIAVGGTEMTRRILPAFGYKPQNSVRYYALPLRPLQQAFTHQVKNWKTPARFLRSMLWRYSTRLTTQSGWSARQIDPGQLPVEILPRPLPGVAVFERSPDLFRYLSRCPVAECVLHVVEHDGRPRGYFCLFFVPGVARIGDAWVSSQKGWLALYRLAAIEALRHGACEIVTAACIAPAETALAACGYRVRKEETFVLYNTSGRLAAGLTYNFQMIDSDVAFLHANIPEYLT
jgi:hypothetical protein